MCLFDFFFSKREYEKRRENNSERGKGRVNN
jgi:hypothetical protein